jgi:L-ribulose-5-phosphate 4-epimerase
MIDEGYIKYHCEWINQAIIPDAAVEHLTAYRDALHQLGFIGVYPNGIGFGNLSQRVADTALLMAEDSAPRHPVEFNAKPSATAIQTAPFIISGTQTGHLKTLTATDYALVSNFDPANNTLTCQGLRQASSESLTHGVIYAEQPTIGAVIHVHHPALWRRLLHQVPTTRASVPYGTPEMAAETQRLFRDSGGDGKAFQGNHPLLQQRIFVMAGHEEGIVTFGKTLAEAYQALIEASLSHGIFTPSASKFAQQLPSPLALPTGDCHV